jgi:hypothetical protein
MLVCQRMVLVLTAVNRFDAVGLHAWESLREVVGASRLGREQSMAELDSLAETCVRTRLQSCH